MEKGDIAVGSKPNPLSEKWQSRWKDKPIYDEVIRRNIDPKVQLHKELLNVRSSAAACINVIGNIAKKKADLISFLNTFNIGVDDILPFPSGIEVGEEKYDDVGNAIFEWIGPKKSPINEKGGKRGQNRTSVDALILAKMNDKVTQLLIEWKFTETYNSVEFFQKFGGVAGNERLRRYSDCLARLRKRGDFPFRMGYEDNFGLYDLGYEPYYQLLRMTLLAKLTTPMVFSSGLVVENYRIVHLSHSDNNGLNYLSRKHLSHSPGLKEHVGESLHEVWKNHVLSDRESSKFHYGYWDEALEVISQGELRRYLLERYRRTSPDRY